MVTFGKIQPTICSIVRALHFAVLHSASSKRDVSLSEQQNFTFGFKILMIGGLILSIEQVHVDFVVFLEFLKAKSYVKLSVQSEY